MQAKDNEMQAKENVHKLTQSMFTMSRQNPAKRETNLNNESDDDKKISAKKKSRVKQEPDIPLSATPDLTTSIN